MAKKIFDKESKQERANQLAEFNKNFAKFKANKESGSRAPAPNIHQLLLEAEALVQTYSQKRRLNLMEKTILQNAEFIKSISFVYERRSDQEIKNQVKSIKERLKNLPSLSKEKLCEMVYGLELELDFYKYFSNKLMSSFGYLLKDFHKTRSSRLAAVKRQANGKDEKYKNNNECLMRCLKEAIPESKALIKPSDFIKFQSITGKNPPPFIQKLRRTKDEKNQTEELQRIDAEALARHVWAPSTLRNFFEKHTGVKSSSLRK